MPIDRRLVRITVASMHIIALIDDAEVIEPILKHLKRVC
jgi:hypothetical protein